MKIYFRTGLCSQVPAPVVKIIVFIIEKKKGKKEKRKKGKKGESKIPKAGNSPVCQVFRESFA
jgi:hypothetical protein